MATTSEKLVDLLLKREWSDQDFKDSVELTNRLNAESQSRRYSQF